MENNLVGGGRGEVEEAKKRKLVAKTQLLTRGHGALGLPSFHDPVPATVFLDDFGKFCGSVPLF